MIDTRRPFFLYLFISYKVPAGKVPSMEGKRKEMEELFCELVEFQSTGGKSPVNGGKKKSNGGITPQDG
jgi:hypothetical protein